MAPLLGLIPGVGPALAAGAGVIGGLQGGSDAQGQTNGLNGQMASQSALPGQLQQQYLPQALQALLGMSQNQNPFGDQTQQNASTDPMVFGDLAARSMTPAFNSAVSQYGDNVGDRTNQMAGGIAHSLGGRGFFGNSSLAPSLFAQNERNAAQDVGANKVQWGTAAGNALQQLAQYQQQQRYSQAVNKGNTMFNRQQTFTSSIPGANIGGLQAAGQNYQGLANTANQGFLSGLHGLDNFNWGGIFHHGPGTGGSLTGTDLKQFG